MECWSDGMELHRPITPMLHHSNPKTYERHIDQEDCAGVEPKLAGHQRGRAEGTAAIGAHPQLVRSCGVEIVPEHKAEP